MQHLILHFIHSRFWPSGTKQVYTMGVWNIAVSLAAVALGVVTAGDVNVLTPDTFDEVVDGSKHVLIKFYAPWCGHCKSMAPAYETVATAFKKVDNVVVAEVDADNHKDLASRFDVKGFPTLKYFPLGSKEAEDYKGGRDEADFVNFLNEKAGTHVRVAKPMSRATVLTDASFDAEVIHSKKHAIVDFYAPWCGHCKKLAPVIEEVATIFEGEENVLIATVDATANTELAERYNVKGYPTVYYFAPGSDEPEDFSGERDTATFVEFINEHAGTHRTVDGGLTAEAGRVEEIDVIISESGDINIDVHKKVQTVVDGLEGSDAKYGALYLKAINKIVAKGPSYVDAEIKRLEGLLENDNVSPQKKTLFALRKNILNAFQKTSNEKTEL
ncbi:protein disulfide-isomerase domain [Plasmopara halstedii]|uniref:protein disulfide-isomerase n=1 Tax=Plasmopara halstedii TaxID=4781 RepID=A0A0P1ATQ4_PLAHL|nr:protein disulfide-isomerase domain [Plasmopara halstedii]CEG45578.1 protein disulfide-isomerase domain [Plasmopara halstedii]|eukprot:XP_024581947.1 protein disulfide-isomerase domain [Plasmopara halstedii]